MTEVNASSADLIVIQSGVAAFLGRPLADAGALDGVRCAIAGIPWDEGNAGRNGANMGPRAFRDASSWFLGYDAQRDFDLWEALPAADVGDIPVVPPNAERTMRLIEDHVRSVREGGILPLCIGGNHALAIGAARRAAPIAIDLVEIAPIYDLSGISTRLACGVALEMLAGVCGR